MHSKIVFFLALLIFFRHSGIVSAEEHSLISRGEHRIEIQRYGRINPEVSIDILQSDFYNENHDEYVIRIEDLNKTLNKEINEDVTDEYNRWFNEAFENRLHEYFNQPQNQDNAVPSKELQK